MRVSRHGTCSRNYRRGESALSAYELKYVKRARAPVACGLDQSDKTSPLSHDRGKDTRSTASKETPPPPTPVRFEYESLRGRTMPVITVVAINGNYAVFEREQF